MSRQIKKKAMIKTKRLTLRPYSEQDIEMLMNILTTPEVISTFMVPETESMSCLKKLEKRMISFSQLEDDEHLEYGIYLREKIIAEKNIFVNIASFVFENCWDFHDMKKAPHPRCST